MTASDWHFHRIKMTNSSMSRLWTIVQIEQSVPRLCTYTVSDKDALHNVSATRKTRTAITSCVVEQLFSKLLKIFKKTKVVGSYFSEFCLVYCYGENWRFTKDIIRIFEESHFSFFYCIDLFVATYKICRDVLGTQSNIYDGALLRQ